jgi:hypothetical protein
MPKALNENAANPAVATAHAPQRVDLTTLQRLRNTMVRVPAGAASVRAEEELSHQDMGIQYGGIPQDP